MKARYAILVTVIAVACGGPTRPGPIINQPPPDPGPVVTNTPPVIGKFTVQGTRTNEPPNFADASEEVPISVEVEDAETAIQDLKYNWSAPSGTFMGEGREVVWKAPSDVGAPEEIEIQLEIVETYTSQGKDVENKVSGSVKLSLHDSVKEVSEMARQFLLDFSDSRITSVAYIMRNFEPTCYGTEEETGDVTNNRKNFEIKTSNIGTPTTSIRFGGICPRDQRRGDACSQIFARWQSEALRDVGGLRAGDKTEASGIDQVASMYYRDQKRWKLCDSRYFPDPGSLRAAQLRGMVP